MKSHPPLLPPAGSVAVIGLGNIGSPFVDQLARLPGVKSVVLVDRDFYEASNLRTQNITRRDVGCAKSAAQGRRLRVLNPALAVRALSADVAQLPPAALLATVIVAALDSLEARLVVNEIAWRLGVPWIDAGIEPRQRLVRINAYRPDPSQGCLECALDDADYARLTVRHPCDGPPAGPPPTNGPASLGALAAALLAVECGKILAGEDADALIGRQEILDTVNHRHFVTAFPRHPRCRFDHASWRLEMLPRVPTRATLGSLLQAARRAVHGGPDTAFTVARQDLAAEATCLRCGATARVVHLTGRIRLRCRSCGARQFATSGCALIDGISADLPPAILDREARAAGFAPGDVLCVTTEGHDEHHLVIPDDSLR